MKSRTTTEFRKLFADLPETIQAQTRKAYRQFKQDPNYPSFVTFGRLKSGTFCE